jgi:hypothetical protein
MIALTGILGVDTLLTLEGGVNYISSTKEDNLDLLLYGHVRNVPARNDLGLHAAGDRGISPY